MQMHVMINSEENSAIKSEITPNGSDNEIEDEDDAEKRLARSRERNREHARRTRVRKKAQLEALQTKVKQLESENRVLKQSVEECSIASILLGLSSGGQDASAECLIDPSLLNTSKTVSIPLVMAGKRKRFVSDNINDHLPQPLKLDIDGQTTLIGGGKTHINWKSGVYCDENGIQRQLTQEQLENLRRERNRMHAKMTRDRKKCFIASVQRTIAQLENENRRLTEALAKQAKHRKTVGTVTPLESPRLAPSRPTNSPVPPVQNEVMPSPTPTVSIEPRAPQVVQTASTVQFEKSTPIASQKRSSQVTHGFTVVA